MRLTADAEIAGARVDAWVAKALAVSRRRAVELLGSGELTLNGAVVQPRRHVRMGDVLEGEPSPAPPAGGAAEPGAVPVVFQDEHLAVVDKPAGLSVHPGAGRGGGTLVNILLGMKMPLAAAAGAHRPGLVHRLDLDTSGLLIVAKTDEAYWALVRMIAKRAVTREYLAVVRGIPKPPRGTIQAGMARDPRDPQKFAVVSSGGKRSTTFYEVIERFKGAGPSRIGPEPSRGASLVRVTLGTGRTHQIRVHFGALGWPVLGDRTYGGDAARVAGIDRQALHAARLEFTHPLTAQELEFQSPLPPDIAALLKALRAG